MLVHLNVDQTVTVLEIKNAAAMDVEQFALNQCLNQPANISNQFKFIKQLNLEFQQNRNILHSVTTMDHGRQSNVDQIMFAGVLMNVEMKRAEQELLMEFLIAQLASQPIALK
jgi:hypothetical protein